MRRLWPSSLYGQILLAAALALLVVQLINANLRYQSMRNRATAEASWMLAGIAVNNISAETDGRPNEAPPHIVKITRSADPLIPEGFGNMGNRATSIAEQIKTVNPSIQAVRLSMGPMNSVPPDLRPDRIYRGMRAVRNERRHRREREAVLLTMQLQNGEWVNAVAAVRPYRFRPIATLLLETLLLYLAVLIPLAWIASRIARPLKTLTQRVGTVGLAGDLAPVEPRGPSDVRELIEAFNIADARLSALLTEKDVMLGAIGHDLKTPLASLRVRIESVEDESERSKMAGTIDEMVHILDDILILARLGKSAEQPVLTEIGALVEMVAEEFGGADRVRINASEGKCRAMIRPVLLRRAVRNLIGNAVQYGTSAELTTRCDGGQVQIMIDDSGPGIDAAMIPSMFEPFSRAETSRNRASGGSGLGLTIARAIARAHGGDVSLENRPEGGLRAILTISQKSA